MKVVRMIIWVALLGLCTSCTQHNGHIGKLFGTWQLMTVQQGEKETTVETMYYKFQGTVLNIRWLTDEKLHETKNVYGMFSHEGDRLICYHVVPEWGTWDDADNRPYLNMLFVKLENADDPSGADIHFKIERLTSSALILSPENQPDKKLVFRKF